MKIPICMATQHPDSTRYVPVQKEPEEALECFSVFDCDEYMVDYEGKLTPYHQNAQIVSEVLSNTDLVPGKDIFITPRMSSAEEEVVFRQLMAIMAIMEANHISIGMSGEPSITEVIHPMSKSHVELFKAKERIHDIMHIAKKEIGLRMDWEQFNIIPLVEQVPRLFSINDLIGNFVSQHKAEFGFELESMRVFIGKSDPAIGFGHVASCLACKIAISDLYGISKETGISCHPIMGVGSLPFRGALTLENVENFISEYSGVRTVTIQSGLRYNHGPEDTRKVVGILKDKLQGSKPLYFSKEEKEEIMLISGIFTKNYLKALTGLNGLICDVAAILPNQRDRLVQKGALGYARDVKDLEIFAKMCSKLPKGREVSRELLGIKSIKSLPRAIKFTASLYTLGFPPEFIGTGRGLEEIRERIGQDALEALISKYYPSLIPDLEFAGRFLNMQNIESFIDSPGVFALLSKDVTYCIDILGLKIDTDKKHNILGEMSVPYIRYFLGTEEKVFEGKKEQELKDAAHSLIFRMSEKRGSLG